MTHRQFFDAWFSLLAIPGTVYLRFIADTHRCFRP